MTHSRRECNEGENRMMMLLNKIFMDENNLEVLFLGGGGGNVNKETLSSLGKIHIFAPFFMERQ